jgi:hypothetical protein
MKAHQAIIREQRAAIEGREMLFHDAIPPDLSFCRSVVKEIDSRTASAIILEYEWLGSMPQAVKACYGIYWDGFLGGAIVLAEKPGANRPEDKISIVPAEAHYLARGACVHWTPKNTASYLISRVFSKLIGGNQTVLAYSDTMAGEVGTIYQALGWYYIGPSHGGSHGFLVDGRRIGTRSLRRSVKGSHGLEDVKRLFPSAKVVQPIPRPGRYVGVFGDRWFKREMRERFTPIAKPYPKRES